jgi:hypothetical protein
VIIVIDETSHPSADAAAVAALQAALAAENAAIYGCGVAGAHLTGGQLNAVTRAWDAHRARRDQLTAMLRARGTGPAAAPPSYRLPVAVNSARDAVSLALLLEDRLTTAYLGLVALAEADLRSFGALAMQEAAVRAAGWRGRTVAFPGLPVSAITSPRAREDSATDAGRAAALSAAGTARHAARHRQRKPGHQGSSDPGAHTGRVTGKKETPKPKQHGTGAPGKPG